jgi:hypothetical protein
MGRARREKRGTGGFEVVDCIVMLLLLMLMVLAIVVQRSRSAIVILGVITIMMAKVMRCVSDVMC